MTRFEPVAVVGQACVLPGALDPEALWSGVVAARDLTTPAPAGRWRIDPTRVGAAIGGGPDLPWSDRGAFVVGFEGVFDPQGFAVPAEEILPLDRLFQWVLHTAREALRGAGHDAARPAPRAGLVIGNLSFPTASLSLLAEAAWLDDLGPDFLGGRARALAGVSWPDPRNRFMSGLPALLAASALRLGAGAFALDAACASSLYAIKIACDALHDRRADLMVAGGVSAADDLFLRVGFRALKALSPTGRSRPFHREADGLLPGEGAAMVVLKRLRDAEAAGDRILGVIRAVGLSNDGRGAGFLVPHEHGQRRAMQQAYAMADLRPADVSLLECHATGTPVGDVVEVESAASVFGGTDALPAGSLKANLGHLFAAAGAAGLLKVLGALRARTLPPARHADEPHAALARSPLTLLAAPEPWSPPGKRIAAVSAFGFGGNNAHLVVEEWEKERGTSIAVGEPAPAPAVAVVAMAVLAADGRSTEDFLHALFSGEPRTRPGPDGMPEAPAQDVALEIDALRSPPRDLERSLAQQCLVLRAAQEACAAVHALPAERTSVFVGMQCDGAVAMHGVRARLAEWTAAWQSWRGAPVPSEWLAEAQAAVVAAPDSASVIGMLPNMPANRLSSQLGLTGPGFTVSAEELSGLAALRLGARALQAGDADACLVGAVDLACDPTHMAAARRVLDGPRMVPGDAALVMVLKRLEDARRDGDSVHAVLEDPDVAGGTLDVGESLVLPLFGHAHAASGLLQAAAAVAACRHRARPGGGDAPATPWLPGRPPRRAAVSVSAMAGAADRIGFAVSEQAAAEPVLTALRPRLHVFSGPDRRAVLDAARAGRESDEGAARLVVVAASDEERAERCALGLRLLEEKAPTALPPGIAFHDQPVEGELAFVFTGPAGAYRGMGRDLLLALPELLGPVSERFRGVDEAAGWIYRARGAEPAPADKLWGASLLCQVHATLSRSVLGLRPQAAIGMCSGETNALFALGAWTDLDGLQRDIEEAGVYTRVLAGEFEAVRKAWGTSGPIEWSNWRFLAPLEGVRAALRDEPRAHLMIVNAPDDCIIGGESEACRRVVDRVGAARARPLGYEIAIHCPEIASFREGWRRLHRRDTRAVDGVRFYTHATLGSYVPDADSAADALTGQAMGTVDFPALVERAWADGVRVFLEHGPQGGCTRWIGRILGHRPHAAASLDLAGESSLRQAANALAELVAAGAAVDRSAFDSRLARASRRPSSPRSATVVVPAHRPSRLPAALLSLGGEDPVMVPAPRLARILEAEPVDELAPLAPSTAPPMMLAAFVDQHRRMAEAHQAFLGTQSEVHRRFLATRSAVLPSRSVPRPAASAPPPSPAPAKRQFSREQLEVLASGRISSVFGPEFAAQDDYPRQVRMPEPPLLLTDRVTALEAEPLSMGTGLVRTETDVRWDSWYLHDGGMPPGLMIEAGQSDLLLISWLGVDRHNRGERVYRLLGSEITFHGPPARPGETLRFDIRCEGHARQDDVRLFFFSSECRVGERRRVTVRNGQAGFFTDEELANSGGVLWDPATAEPARPGRVDPPAVRAPRDRFREEDVRAFSEGRSRACFGEGYALAETHVRTPRIPRGDMMLLGEVTRLDTGGGPWKRGYLRAQRRIAPDDWFFQGHFKDDPCMPGTLMFDGCLQALAFYLAACGFTLDKDGWRFEPVPDSPVPLRCRGQVTPASRQLVYEVFVEELIAGPIPTLYAQVLCTVDGLRACHCGTGMGVQLVPDWPLTSRPDLLAGHADPVPVAEVEGFRFGYASLLASAWGPPADSFGPIYASFTARKLPRLPGPPYHFISRVTRIDGPIGSVRAGTSIEAEYDVAAERWPFLENGHATLPWAVFLEVGLQPCGWLAMSTGAARDWGEDVHFRNLDGTATWTKEVLPDARLLRTHVRLAEVSRSAGVVLTSFEVEYRLEDEVVGRMQTVFGFFPTSAFADQPGLPATDEEKAWLDRPSTFHVDLRTAGGLPAGAPRLAGGRLLMLDRVTGYWPEAGAAALGRLRAEMDVDAAAWFFKAHFFQDPVQPGSLGLEAMVQLLQFYVVERGLAEGMRAPRFLPLDLGRTLRWKYRGQVVPSNRKVVVEVEVTAAGRDEARAYAVAEAWLWVDGKRIYAASDLGVRVVEDEASAAPVGAADERTSPLDATGARSYWRRRVGAGPGLAEDLVDALARRFVDTVSVADPAALAAIDGRPVLFLANHQVGIESLLFSVLVSGLHGRVLVALAKAEHRESWLGRLARVLAEAPGTADPRNLVFFDRSDSASLLAIVDELRSRMRDEDASLLVHVEGTRALAAGLPVTRVSGVWTDLALAAGAAIVPVRFAGGLPSEAARQRLEFPVGFGRQTYHLGRPLLPEQMRPLDLAARQRRVLDAINGLGSATDAPSAPSPDFAREVAAWRDVVGEGGGRAVLLASLAGLGSPSAETSALLEAVRGARPLTDDGDVRQRWMAAVVRWLAGEPPTGET